MIGETGVTKGLIIWKWKLRKSNILEFTLFEHYAPVQAERETILKIHQIPGTCSSEAEHIKIRDPSSFCIGFERSCWKERRRSQADEIKHGAEKLQRT